MGSSKREFETNEIHNIIRCHDFSLKYIGNRPYTANNLYSHPLNIFIRSCLLLFKKVEHHAVKSTTH